MRAAAAEVGVSLATWHRWECGDRGIPLDLVALIEDALEIDHGRLFGPRLREVMIESVGASLDPRQSEFVDDAVECGVAIYRDLWNMEHELPEE